MRKPVCGPLLLAVPLFCLCAAGLPPRCRAAAILKEDGGAGRVLAAGELLLVVPPTPLGAASGRRGGDEEEAVEACSSGGGEISAIPGDRAAAEGAEKGEEVVLGRDGQVCPVGDARSSNQKWQGEAKAQWNDAQHGRDEQERERESEEEGDAEREDYDDETMEWEEDEGDYDDDDDDDDDEEETRVTSYSSMTVSEMWYHAFDCERIFRTPRPIHNESTWTFLRGVYLGVMMTASGAATDPLPHQQQPGEKRHHNSTRSCHGPTINRLAPLGSGFRKAVTAKQTDDGKGRGVYAAEPIRRGELVWTATASTARFPSGDLYRQFLAIIPADLACDVLQWAYVQDVAHFHDDARASSGSDLHNSSCPPDNATETRNISSTPQPVAGSGSVSVLRVSVDLDEGSYMNGEDYDPNVGCLPEEEEEEVDDDGAQASSSHSKRMPSRCQQDFYALRDIGVGEELLCYYGDFANSEAWTEFGL